MIELSLSMERPKSYIEQLADYILKNIRKGYTLESLHQSLLQQGYSRYSIEQATELANLKLAAEAPKMKEKPQITYKILDELPKPSLFTKIKHFLFG
jgi:SOS response regulatory protein OraA/RecX